LSAPPPTSAPSCGFSSPPHTSFTPAADGHRVSVVVPTIDRSSISECLDALARQTRSPDELIVVKDRERRGASRARNEGIRRATGDIVAFTDDDCIPPPGWLERFVGELDRWNADGAGGTLADTDPFLAEVRRRRQPAGGEGPEFAACVGNTGNVAYRRSALEALRVRDGFVFDERYRSAEDVDLAIRLRSIGAVLAFVDLPVLHVKPMGRLSYLKAQYRRGRGIALLRRTVSRFPDIGTRKSLAWRESGGKADWLRAAWHKGIGPFDRSSFSTFGRFLLFWLGEKAQGVGFLIERIMTEREHHV
jgi:glycosyltransferase involved in cell wall biosynthesis